nr:TolC family protein [uncultured Cohaesibacter sp.]
MTKSKATSFLPPQATARPLVRIILSGLALAFLTACASVQPEALDPLALEKQTRADLVTARDNVEPIHGKLSLDEAMARALKYNLDRRVKMMEEALAMKQLDASKYDMLPQLLAQSGYSWRNNDKISLSRNASTGALSTSRFISQEREHETASLGLTWNMLDFGLSYYSAKQQADRLLIAGEKRRKSMHLLMQDVRTAFWRAYSAQRLRGAVQATTARAEDALRDARRAEVEALRNPLDSLRYQRQVLENLRLLEAINQELSTARLELAALINAPPDQKLVLAAPDGTVNRKILRIPTDLMEEIAMLSNADLREQHYNAHIAQQETRKAVIKMFPNLSLNFGGNMDSDVYLLNESWLSAGAQISYNLFNLTSGPKRIKQAKAGVAVAEQQRVATQMAVLAQVHLARQNYANALHQYVRADQIWQTDRRILDHMKNRELAQTQSKLDHVANQTTAILSRLRRYQALALVQSTEAKLQATLGVDPVIGNVQQLSLDDLTHEIATHDQVWSDLAAHKRLLVARSEMKAAAK